LQRVFCLSPTLFVKRSFIGNSFWVDCQWADEVDFDKPLYNELSDGIVQKIEMLFDETR
jgi:hypothetical protein